MYPPRKQSRIPCRALIRSPVAAQPDGRGPESTVTAGLEGYIGTTVLATHVTMTRMIDQPGEAV